ncbi:hypothetical protein IKF12_00610 [Candidatus Saccharibacteria bacterium]|nr:hypothetical protein [Candidatus Saccharibacteria bacterium]
MEQNADAGTPVAPVMDNKQKSSNGLKIATAIAYIVAVCGIGFGVYGIVQSSQKDNRIAELENQLKDDENASTAPSNILVSKQDDSKDWVYDAEYEKDATVDSYSTTFDTYYLKDIIVPYINIDSLYAKDSNREIKSVFDDAINTYNKGVDDRLTYVDECGYDEYRNGNNLSIVLKYGIGATDVVHPKYYTYNIDLKTGNGLSYEEVYSVAGFDSDSIKTKVESAITVTMKEKLSGLTADNYPDGTTFDTYNNESISNYEESVRNKALRYFLSEDKRLNVIVKLSIPAGTGEFDTIIPVEN